MDIQNDRVYSRRQIDNSSGCRSKKPFLCPWSFLQPCRHGTKDRAWPEFVQSRRFWIQWRLGLLFVRLVFLLGLGLVFLTLLLCVLTLFQVLSVWLPFQP